MASDGAEYHRGYIDGQRAVSKQPLRNEGLMGQATMIDVPRRMPERDEVVARLAALDLERGDSASRLAAIAGAVYEPVCGWTVGACANLRDRLSRLIGDSDAVAFAERVEEAVGEGQSLDLFGTEYVPASDQSAQHDALESERRRTIQMLANADIGYTKPIDNIHEIAKALGIQTEGDPSDELVERLTFLLGGSEPKCACQDCECGDAEERIRRIDERLDALWDERDDYMRELLGEYFATMYHTYQVRYGEAELPDNSTFAEDIREFADRYNIEGTARTVLVGIADEIEAELQVRDRELADLEEANESLRSQLYGAELAATDSEHMDDPADIYHRKIRQILGEAKNLRDTLADRQAKAKSRRRDAETLGRRVDDLVDLLRDARDDYAKVLSEARWVELPRDADGTPIRPGDTLVWARPKSMPYSHARMRVDSIELDGAGWNVNSRDSLFVRHNYDAAVHVPSADDSNSATRDDVVTLRASIETALHDLGNDDLAAKFGDLMEAMDA